MKWDTIRIHYVMLLRASGRTQAAVAAAGKLSGQNAISKLVRSRTRGPSVETFTKAVHGLGLTLAAFFAGLDDAAAGKPSVAARIAALERALAHAQHATSSSKRPHGQTLSESLAGTATDQRFVAALVHEAFQHALAEVAAQHGVVLPGGGDAAGGRVGPHRHARPQDDSEPTRRGSTARRRIEQRP